MNDVHDRSLLPHNPVPRKTAPRRLRPPTLADLHTIEKLERHFFGKDGYTLRQLQYYRRNPRAFFRVVRDDSGTAPTGYILALRRNHCVHIYTIAVAPSRHRRGTGGLLLDAALRAARHEKATNVILEARARKTALLRFYESHGFIRALFLPAYYDDGANAWRMVKDL